MHPKAYRGAKSDLAENLSINIRASDVENIDLNNQSIRAYLENERLQLRITTNDVDLIQSVTTAQSKIDPPSIHLDV